MVLASLVDHSLSITDIYDYLFDWCPWTLNMTKKKKLILEIILLTEGRAHSFFHGLISIKERHSVNQLQPHFQKDIHWRLQTGESKSRCKNKNHSTGFTFTYCLFVFLNLDEKVLLLCLHAGCNITGLSVLCKKALNKCNQKLSLHLCDCHFVFAARSSRQLIWCKWQHKQLVFTGDRNLLPSNFL